MTAAARRALDAAGRLFYEHGIHAVGVDLIAVEAGVTKKTLYDRFGSKEQIVVEYLADRDERWRAFLAPYIEAAATPRARILAVFDALRDWADGADGRLAKGCGMVNAHAEISDPAHPAYPIIVGQKAWMLALFTDVAGGVAPSGAEAARLGRTLMLLHEGALVAHGLRVFPDAVEQARGDAEALLEAVAKRGSAHR
ncbi:MULTISPECIES: TetR/AcrR family transcriptional regulator [Streptomyces]|uniref:TetR family transcriptional regulator n=1 Tax=Streptomyces venezuelae TaxID=54571 RepID=A0A5P2BLC6_STRVZ|nr:MULTISPECIES: TetR/AcrR family transcriptional regulator [Streptomyces]NEA05686.1 helix-turn-helix transcriptional regulator [Streptomyces sp. SID10116]MYY85497.1 TetR family transcriptional regulator [Streptomyces sp. SID335]MYZ16073.1 TetR family transcriptional regulator [Streptomyces sp. SID337]NDZ90462.1 helix-turn-helix transcriptional regulator [Streptomyces sp. SID10115]NEB50108.1 helix-turn-helix transcriptional regulator [Streptomyces sp. SID339]